MNKVKSIKINVSKYGNSYFSAFITVEREQGYNRLYCIPITYGYESKYLKLAYSMLVKNGVIPEIGQGALFLDQYCWENGIQYAEYFKYGCKKRELLTPIRAADICLQFPFPWDKVKQQLGHLVNEKLLYKYYMGGLVGTRLYKKDPVAVQKLMGLI